MIFGHLKYNRIFNIIFFQHISDLIFVLLGPAWQGLRLLNLLNHFDIFLPFFIISGMLNGLSIWQQVVVAGDHPIHLLQVANLR